ncbi:DUF4236 domain-containing protein [Herbaspirillum sp. WKF16]|uniref:DUF4236 domain-containing protein n=1 Tax=Herbaspirillum sp. WKF16 TaxID=3028312 RepID=UPI0023A96331|nr:DUF4236 domain-containing protein [Herbaspirillum sp. WKF16]WDZ97329.1 DUF4236 domain-containing protein [Herbaspirillum sp. WKF16]
MGWGFRKSFKIAPGVRINVSKRGVSTSVGVKGFTVNSRGRVTTSIPGTGISHTTTLGVGKKSRARTTQSIGDTEIAQTKREVENETFATNLWQRRRAAISSYFLSHGILVGMDDVDSALSMQPHDAVFAGLTPQFSETTEAMQLLQDIGSLSLAAKEKAMKALYVIENTLDGARGTASGISEGLQDLNIATQSTPQAPKFWAYVFWVIVLGFFSLGAPQFAVVPIIVLCVGLYKKSQYKKKLVLSNEAVVKANAKLDQLIEHELTSRKYFLSNA